MSAAGPTPASSQVPSGLLLGHFLGSDDTVGRQQKEVWRSKCMQSVDGCGPLTADADAVRAVG